MSGIASSTVAPAVTANATRRPYLLAVDGSEASLAAARWLGDLCRNDPTAHVIALYVFEPQRYYARQESEPMVGSGLPSPLDVAMRHDGGDVHDAALHALGLDASQVEALLRIGRPEDVIPSVAREEDAGAVVLGRTRAGVLHRLVRPSLADRLESRVACPVVGIALPVAA